MGHFWPHALFLAGARALRKAAYQRRVALLPMSLRDMGLLSGKPFTPPPSRGHAFLGSTLAERGFSRAWPYLRLSDVDVDA